MQQLLNCGYLVLENLRTPAMLQVFKRGDVAVDDLPFVQELTRALEKSFGTDRKAAKERAANAMASQPAALDAAKKLDRAAKKQEFGKKYASGAEE